MEIVGIVALVVVALFVVAALVVLLLSLPDIARYRHIRQM